MKTFALLVILAQATAGTGDIAVIRVAADVAAARLQSKVAPVYPPLARVARVQGTVMVELTINKEGRVADSRIVKGHPLLNDGTLEMVRQWQYKPYEVNREPTPVLSTVTINFVLINPPSIPAGTGVITGRIVHADGRPATGMRVDVALPAQAAAWPADVPPVSFTENSGEYRLEARGGAVLRAGSPTDSSGEYRIQGIGPGNYLITAVVGDQVIYYPGTSKDGAVSVTIENNQTALVAIDFRIP